MKRTSKQFWAEYEEADFRTRDNMFADWYKELEVGDKAHVHCYSDVKPCTVIKATKTTLTVRYDKATLDPSWKPEWISGGFSAHCTNNDEQKWNIEEDANGRVEVFRWHNSEDLYMNRAGERLYPEWRKFYDYNF